MFLPSKIEKIRLILPKNYYDRAITLLGELGFLQIEVLESESKKVLKDFKEIEFDKINKYGQKIRSLENNLIKQKVTDIGIKNLQQVYNTHQRITFFDTCIYFFFLFFYFIYLFIYLYFICFM